ncbi:hypothetical protein A9K56_10250 [Stenotrophomonas maltophilia]|uniref:Uncharacterized protein n=2 Tax=Stenotrophomonas maltophilia TaxID=40324 RepID=A0AAP7L0X1_STEMA|nr:hypothetical protein A9K56_10250 [Stenotrophomonas maltophilia]
MQVLSQQLFSRYAREIWKKIVNNAKFVKIFLLTARATSVGALVYFYSRASSLYRLVRECLDHVGDVPAFEACKRHPDSIQFELIGMTVAFFAILALTNCKILSAEK